MSALLVNLLSVSLVAMMMITVPIFVPVVNALGFDVVWFAVLYLVNVEVAAISPPKTKTSKKRTV